MVITKTNRIISFILVVCMVFSMLPVQVFADFDSVNLGYTVKYYKDSIDSEDNLLGVEEIPYEVLEQIDEEEQTINYGEIELNAYQPDNYSDGSIQESVSDTYVKNDGSSIVYVLYVAEEDVDNTETVYTVKYYKDSIDSEDNFLGKYQVVSYSGSEINFDEINLNTYLPENYDGGIVVKASSDSIVKANGSSVVYVLYTPATPEGQALLNEVMAKNEEVEDITDHIVYIDDFGYDKFALNFATNVATIKSDTIPTDTILVIDGSLTMLDQVIKVNNGYSGETTTITGEQAVREMVQAFTEYYFETQPDNSKLGVITYGYNSSNPYDQVIELTELGKSSVETFTNLSLWHHDFWNWGNGVYALQKAKNMFLEAEHLYQGQDGNYYERARHVILIGSNSFATYQTHNQAAVYNPQTTSNQEGLNQTTFIKGQLGDILMANNVGATIGSDLLAHYEYGYGYKSAENKNEAWKNLVIDDKDTWGHTVGNFDRIQEGCGATFHTVGLFTSYLSRERREQAEALYREMANDGEFYMGDNTTDLYEAITDIIADMYVSNDVYIDVIIDNNFKVINAPLADRVLKNSDDTTTVMYGPLKADGIFHIEGDIAVAAREEAYKEEPTYKIVAYTYVNGNKVILTQYDTIAEVEEEELNSSKYTPITSFEYELVGTTVILKKFIGDEKEIKIAPSYNINGNIYKVTKIGDNCFEGSDIVSIEMNDKITKIGMEAFKDCANLKSVKLPENLKALYNGVFKNCVNLKSIEFPESMYYLGSYAFYNTGLTHADIVDTITYMGMYCFSECDELVSVDFSKKLQRIANHCFEGCDKLAEVVLPENVYAINDYAFAGCTAMTTAEINKECYFIGQNAFANCSIEKLQIPCTALYGVNSFANAVLKEITVVQGKYEYSLLANYGNNKALGLADGTFMNSVWQMNKDTVKKIVFKGCTGVMGESICEDMDVLEEVVIEEGITKIGHFNFADCDNLVTLKFPDSLGAIPYLTATSCDKLKHIDFGEGITFIGYGAFSYCPEIEELVLPDSLTGMDTLYGDHGPFLESKNITKLTMPITFALPNSTGLAECAITDLTFTYGSNGIGADRWFAESLNLGNVERLTVEHGITSLGNGLMDFYWSEGYGWKITYVSLPNTLTVIDAYALTNLIQAEKMVIEGEEKDHVVFEYVTEIEEGGLSEFGQYKYDDCNVILEFNQKVSVGKNAFSFSSFEEVIFNNGVSYIGPYAFNGSKIAKTQKFYNLTGVDKIDDYAFYNCVAMEECVIGDDLTYIGTNAFANTAIKELVLGKKLETIEPDAFVFTEKLMHIFVDEANPWFETNEEGTILWNEDKTEILWISDLYAGELFLPKATTLTSELVRDKKYITKIVIEEGNVTEIPTNAFRGCIALEEIVIPNGITSIGVSSFMNCSSLKEVVLPEGVTTIGSTAFAECTSLTNIQFPSTLKTICPGGNDGGAFRNCASLVHIEFNEGLEYIGGNWGSTNNSCFYGCYRLESVTLPSTLKNGSTHMFSSCGSLAYVYLNEGSTTLSVNEDNTAFMNYDGSTVYWSCTHITDTSDITEIPDNAYKGNASLRRYVIADTIVRIGKSAFESSGLAGVVTIPSSVTEIGQSAFYSVGVKEFIINASVETIPVSFAAAYAFSNARLLRKVTFNTNTIKTIGGNAFSNQSLLEGIEIPEGVEVIDYSAFNGCYGMTYLTLPSTLKTIGSSTFRGCSSLTEVIIPEGTTTIGSEAFYGCSNLEYVEIPASVTSLNSNAFNGCGKARIHVHPDNPNYASNEDGTVLYNKAKTQIIWMNTTAKVIDISDSALTTIPNSFGSNVNLEKVILPATATSINGSAFSGCTSLKEINFPEGLVKFNGWTFKNCTSLKELTIPSTMTNINVTDFINTGLEHIYVADGNTTFTTNEDNTALYNADKTICYWAVEIFRVNDRSFNDLQMAIDAAKNGDIIYVTDHYTMVSAVTIPANKELTFMPLVKDVVIYQNGNAITNNSKMTIKGNEGYTLKFSGTNATQFNAYADIVIDNGAILWGGNKNNNVMIEAKTANMVLTVKNGALIGNKYNVFNNNNGATYVVEPGAKFDSCSVIVSKENGTYENFSATFTNCYQTLDRVFMIGEDENKMYSKLEDAITNASNGDTIYVLGDYTPLAQINIPADKELTLKAKDKDATIYQIHGNYAIVNNSKLTISGGDNGETLTIKANTGMQQIKAYADVVLESGAVLYGYAKGNNTIVQPYASMTLTVQSGATMGYANYAFYNKDYGTYVIEADSNFTDLTYIVYTENGTYENLTANFTNCTNSLDKPFEVNGVCYKTLAEAITAAVDGDTIYVCADASMTTQVTFPADKTLTLEAKNGNWIVQNTNNLNPWIVVNGNLTIKADDENSLTLAKVHNDGNLIHVYGTLTTEGNVTLKRPNQYNSLIRAYANSVVNLGNGTVMAMSQYGIYNDNATATINIGDVVFEDLKSTVYAPTSVNIASVGNITQTNVTNPLVFNFKIGNKNYVTIESAVKAAVNGDIIYVLNDYTLSSALTIPADKELTFSAYDKDVVISQSATISSNSKLTIKGKDGHTLTMKTTKTGINLINAYADVVVDDGAIIGCYQKGNYSIVCPYAIMTLTVKSGATMMNANNAFYNIDSMKDATYVVEPGAKFENITYVVKTENGTYTNKTATFINCDDTLDMAFEVGENYYNTLQEAINAAVDGDIIYVIADATMTTAITFPANKNLTLCAKDGDWTISQTVNNSWITVKGNLTVKAEEGSSLTLFKNYKDGNLMDVNGTLTTEGKVTFKRYQNSSYSLILAGANSVVTLNDGATLTTSKYGLYNAQASATINVRSGVVFDNLQYGAYSLTNGINKVGAIINNNVVANQLVQNSEYIMVNDKFYDVLQDAVDAANNGDTIYIVGDIEVSTETVIPENKELTFSAYKQNVVITQSATIINNSKVTVTGKDGNTLTINSTTDSFSNLDNVDVLEDAALYKGLKFSLKAAESNIVSGKPGWSGNWNGVYWENLVDLGNNLNFEYEAPADGTYYFYATAACNTRNYKLYVDDVLIGVYTDSLTRVPIELTAGTHTIRVAQDSGYPPMWDTFYVETDMVLVKGEDLRPIMVNDVGYDTLKEAIEAANSGDTIYIKSDVSIGRYSIDKEVTIMPLDKDVTISVTADRLYIDAETTFSGNGEYTLTVTRTGNFDLIQNNSVLHLNEGVIINGTYNSSYAAVYNSATGTMYINEGAIMTDCYNAVWTNGVVYVNTGAIFKNVTNKCVHTASGSYKAADGIVYENVNTKLTVNWTPEG